MTFQMRQPSFLVPCSLLFFILCACTDHPGPAHEQSPSLPPIVPDYCNVTLPCNMALPAFMVEGATHIRAEVQCGGENMVLEGEDELCLDDIKSLTSTLAVTDGQEAGLSVTLSVWSPEHPSGIRYAPFAVTLSADSIDRYVTYRLVPPGYEGWHEMSIRQRDLTCYDERVLVAIDGSDNGCVNCHTSCWGKASHRMYHRRGEGGGTYFVADGREQLVDLKEKGLQGSYPAWHPGGRYIAFANTDTHQGFYHSSRDKIEVYDLAGRMFVYDVQRGVEIADERFADSTLWHTFPAFSHDGRTLYYCRARAVDMPHGADSLRYELVAADFDAETGALGADRTMDVAQHGRSVSFPRVSPDGRFLMFTVADCGTFPIWHKEADLAMIDLRSGAPLDLSAINSDDVESYHCWSSNSRWVVFSSRRDDGRYTRLYFAHIDSLGRAAKPFMLPQRSPRHNIMRMNSYNVPDFADEEI